MGRQQWWHTIMAPVLVLPLVYSLSLTPPYRTQAAILHPALAAFLLPARDVGRYGPYTDSLTGTREAAYGSDRGLVQGVSRTMYFYHVTPKGLLVRVPRGPGKCGLILPQQSRWGIAAGFVIAPQAAHPRM